MIIFEYKKGQSGCPIHLLQRVALLADCPFQDNKSQKNFGVIVSSKLYDLALVAKTIVDSEAKFCTFALSQYNGIYKKTKITLFTDGEGEKIYTIKYSDTSEWFRFAVRGCMF